MTDTEPRSEGYRYSKALVFATEGELKAVKGIEALVRGYMATSPPEPTPPPRDAQPVRPLCIAVFGAPGSGKSRTVKGVLKTLIAGGIALDSGPQRTINLTQLADAQQLERQLEAALAGVVPGSAPVVFFDEFDAPRDGRPLGWLPWFLAPMEDGAWFSGGSWRPIPRAIFVFAGGTAHRAADFGAHDPAGFRAAKGPDFVSRLRGSLDVLGPNDGNDSERGFRRSAALAYQLTSGLVPEDRRGDPTAAVAITEGLRDALLAAGRFRHGDRSIGAVLEACVQARATQPDPANRTQPLGLEHLPDDHRLSLHVDAGQLDPERIGGTIGLSCSFDDRASGAAMTELALDLWRRGARLAYFRGDPKQDAFAWAPTEHAKAQPSRLYPNRDNIPRVAAFVFGGDDAVPGASPAIEVVRVPGVGLPGWRRTSGKAAAELFRMRWMMNSRCVARVLVEGKTDLSRGRRIQGILEEGMLALATGQAVYVLGGFGGAARYLGGLLGLATGAISASLPPANLELPEHVATLGGTVDLPTRSAQIPDYLSSFALGSSRWPANGLSIDENRELFECTSPARITELVRTGLLRRFGD